MGMKLTMHLFALVYFFLLGTTAYSQIRVACVGNSITAAGTYPAKLSVLLGGRYSVGNYGVSGTTLDIS